MVDNTWEMFSTRGRIKMQWMGGYWIDSPYHVCCLMLPFGSPVIVSCVTALCFTVYSPQHDGQFASNFYANRL